MRENSNNNNNNNNNRRLSVMLGDTTEGVTPAGYQDPVDMFIRRLSHSSLGMQGNQSNTLN